MFIYRLTPINDWHLIFITKSPLNQNYENKGNDQQLTKLLSDKQIIYQNLRKCIETSMPVEYAY